MTFRYLVERKAVSRRWWDTVAGFLCRDRAVTYAAAQSRNQCQPHRVTDTNPGPVSTEYRNGMVHRS